MSNKRFANGNSTYINKLNKIKVLNLIRDRGEISRADISKVLGISGPTVTRVVEDLINHEKLVVEAGIGDSSGGRPPILVKFNGEPNYVIGIDLGTTSIRGALTNLNAETISDTQVPTQVEEGFDGVMDRVGQVIAYLMSSPGVDQSRIFGIGMAVAGLVSIEKNIVEFSPDFGWHNVDIKKAIRSRFGLPVIFDNVSRVMSLGELWYGVGREIKNFICVNIGHGIGAGVVIDGTPLYGSEGMAGEFGHITIDSNSQTKCKCGKHGCLEALASGEGIAAAARDILKNTNRNERLMELCGGDIETITAKMVAQAAAEGDELAVGILSKAAEYIGIGIANMINLFNPEAVIIGGGVSNAGELLFSSIRRSVDRHVISRHINKVKIISVTYGMSAAVMGAVSLILGEILMLNHRNI